MLRRETSSDAAPVRESDPNTDRDAKTFQPDRRPPDSAGVVDASKTPLTVTVEQGDKFFSNPE